MAGWAARFGTTNMSVKGEGRERGAEKNQSQLNFERKITFQFIVVMYSFRPFRSPDTQRTVLFKILLKVLFMNIHYAIFVLYIVRRFVNNKTYLIRLCVLGSIYEIFRPLGIRKL